MTIRSEIDLNAPLTEKQKQMLYNMNGKPIEFDEDCPELTDEQLKRCARVSRKNAPNTITIQLSTQAMEKAQSLGNEYPAVLSRILETALSDNELIRRCL